MLYISLDLPRHNMSVKVNKWKMQFVKLSVDL